MNWVGGERRRVANAVSVTAGRRYGRDGWLMALGSTHFIVVVVDVG